MFMWAILEPCLQVLVVVFIVTQVLIPAIRNRPVFPLFRKSNRRLRHAEKILQEIRVLKDVNKAETEVHNQLQELKKDKETDE